jgi:hypothetical protein
MLNGVKNWITNLVDKRLNFKSIIINKKPDPIKVNPKGKIKFYLSDPNSTLISETDPVSPKLPMRATGYIGGGFPLGSIQGQAAACIVYINNALNYMISKTKKPINHWAATNSLTILPRAGRDVNAYYDRGSLRFFFFPDPIEKRMVYACDSSDVVSHEFGHAYLDILRPDFWNTQSSEVWALHESFGDMTAILSIMQHEEVLNHAIQETNGDLKKTNIISKLAEQMGIGLFHLTNGKDGELPDCLRNAVNNFKYTTPENLPSEGPDSIIINEPHSFSRIFTGAFYDAIVKIYEKNSATMPQKEALVHARDTMATYLLTSIPNIPNTVRIFDALCHQMLQADVANGNKYKNELMHVFNSRNLLINKVSILQAVNYEDWVGHVKNDMEIVDNQEGRTVRVKNTKTIRLTDHLGLMAQNDNPLLALKIEVPSEGSYFFNNQGKLVNSIETNDAEVVDAAYQCLTYLHEKNLVGSHKEATHEIKYGKLIRKHFVCRVCNASNACTPGAPEYGKPWKGANNAGCNGCKGKNPKCGCEEQPIEHPRKFGCFSSVKTGGNKTYTVSQGTRYKSC